jgi:hypothetical protein
MMPEQSEAELGRSGVCVYVSVYECVLVDKQAFSLERSPENPKCAHVRDPATSPTRARPPR